MATCIRETVEESGIALTPDQIVLIGEEKSINGTPITVFETVLDYTPEVKRDPREHLNKRWMKVYDNEKNGCQTVASSAMVFAGKTLSFVSLKS